MTRDLNHMLIILFTFGFINSLRTNVGYIYMIELMPKKWETFIGTFWNCVEGLIYLQATIFFYYISKNWLNFVLIGYFLQIFSTIFVWLLPESPIYLLNKGRYEEMKDAL